MQRASALGDSVSESMQDSKLSAVERLQRHAFEVRDPSKRQLAELWSNQPRVRPHGLRLRCLRYRTIRHRPPHTLERKVQRAMMSQRRASSGKDEATVAHTMTHTRTHSRNRRSDTDSSQPPATLFTVFINQPRLHTRFHITCTWYGSVRSVPAGWTIPSAATHSQPERTHGTSRRAQHSSHPDEGREARRSTSSPPLAGRMLYVERPRVIIWSGTA